MTYFELTPAYGRDYKTKQEVIRAWDEGKDFEGDYQLGFKPVNDLIANAQITLTAEATDSNPNMPDSHGMDHWKVRLERCAETGKRYNARKDGTAVVARMTTYFSMGYGHEGRAPEVSDVLECLLSDSTALDQNFEDWAGDLGYDTDSRKAARIYAHCVKAGQKLKRFLGEELYAEMLYGER